MFITDNAEYRNPSDGKLAVSFSSVKLFERDEERFYRTVVKREALPEERDSHALVYGTAAHCLILEGRETFDRRFAVRPATYESEGETKKWNGNAKVCQRWETDRVAEGRQVVTPADWAQLEQMQAAIAANPTAAALLADGLGMSECAIRLERPALGFNIQGRLDRLCPSMRALLDVKTIEDANDRSRVMLDRGYYRQLAYYLDLAEEELPAHGPWRSCIIWLEKAWPGRCLVEWLNPALLEIGRAHNYRTLGEIAERLATGKWRIAPQEAEVGVPAELVPAAAEEIF